MARTKIAVGLVVAGMGAALVVQQHAQSKLREENLALRQQVEQSARLAEENQRLSNLLSRARVLAPRLPTPSTPVPVPPVGPLPDRLQRTNLIVRWFTNDTPKLTLAQVGPYLEANRRNAGSLLAAFRATAEPTLLQEAMEKYPQDPRVDLAAKAPGKTPPRKSAAGGSIPSNSRPRTTRWRITSRRSTISSRARLTRRCKTWWPPQANRSSRTIRSIPSRTLNLNISQRGNSSGGFSV